MHIHIGMVLSIQCSMLAVIEFDSLAKDVLVFSHSLFLVAILITHKLKIDNTTRTVWIARKKAYRITVKWLQMRIAFAVSLVYVLIFRKTSIILNEASSEAQLRV